MFNVRISGNQGGGLYQLKELRDLSFIQNQSWYELRKICKQQEIPFIVYNDVEILKLLDADGIRMEQDYADFEQLRVQFPRHGQSPWEMGSHALWRDNGINGQFIGK